jgi:ADP-heptose:LPS heptosyltransferase
MLTPLLAKLRARYPDARVFITLPESTVPLYRRHPYGVEPVPYDPRSLRSLFALRARAGFDLAIVPGDNRHSWLARALGARWVVAFAGDRPRYKNWCVDEAVSYPGEPAAWGDMVAGLIEGPAPATYQPDQWPAPDCAPFTRPADPYCVLHVGASSPLKLWEPGKWRQLAAQLSGRGLSVVWSAGPGEQRYVAAIDPEQRYPSYAGALDLAQLWHLLAQARLLIGPDTAIAHLGRVVGVPTVALFGPGSAVICGRGEFWRASPFRAVTVPDFPCRDQRVLFRREISWVRRCGRGTRECGAPRCMQALTEGQVLDAVGRLLDPGGRQSGAG